MARVSHVLIFAVHVRQGGRRIGALEVAAGGADRVERAVLAVSVYALTSMFVAFVVGVGSAWTVPPEAPSIGKDMIGGSVCRFGNLAPLCRHHHRCKQAEGWWLDQPEPGVLIWRTPAGRTYATTPTEYPL